MQNARAAMEILAAARAGELAQILHEYSGRECCVHRQSCARTLQACGDALLS